MMNKFRLEKYKGKETRHICPSCGYKGEFTRYVDLVGNYIADFVGRCNREAKCGYHYSPGQYFLDHPEIVEKNIPKVKQRRVNMGSKVDSITEFDVIHKEEFTKSLEHYEKNNLIHFLTLKFGRESVQKVIAIYGIGTWKDGRTIFWQIDTKGAIRTGKIIAYSKTTGKRSKIQKPSWIHYELRKQSQATVLISGKDNYKLRQCLFGEHLLSEKNTKTIGIVESEKTAIIASIMMPNITWVATGGSSNFKLERFATLLKGKRTVIFPDSSKFEQWAGKVKEAKLRLDLKIEVSKLLENKLTTDQKKEDYDIADFLLSQG